MSLDDRLPTPPSSSGSAQQTETIQASTAKPVPKKNRSPEFAPSLLPKTSAETAETAFSRSRSPDLRRACIENMAPTAKKARLQALPKQTKRPIGDQVEPHTMSNDTRNVDRSTMDRESQGGQTHAHADQKSRAEDTHRRRDRNRSEGDSGSTSSTGDLGAGRNGGVSGGAVPANRSGKPRRDASGPGHTEPTRTDSITFSTSRFGELEIPEEHLLSFPIGIPGFPESRRYVLLDHRPGSLFRWLQSAELPDLAFVVIDPLLIDPDYPMDRIRDELSFLGLDSSEELIVLGICTVPPSPAQPTVNMLAPIGIGLQSRQGAQVILHDARYQARQSFLKKNAA